MKKIMQYIGIDFDEKAYNICIYNPLTDEFKVTSSEVKRKNIHYQDK
jgi:hypothetical protein